MLFKFSNLNSNLVLPLGYLNPALNNSALGGKRMMERGPKWENCHLRIGLNFFKLKTFLSDSDICDL